MRVSKSPFIKGDLIALERGNDNPAAIQNFGRPKLQLNS
jgi:hypothetical protein